MPIYRVSDEERVNTNIGGDQSDHRMTALHDGGWVVTWQSPDPNGSIGVYQQAYAADGTKVGGEFRVNSYTPDDQFAPSITALRSGGWVVTWTSDGQDGDGGGVYQQAFRIAGSAVERVRGAEEEQVNTTTAMPQAGSKVTALSHGGWVVAWISQFQDGAFVGVYQQAYAADGTKIGGETKVYSTPGDLRSDPHVAALGGGRWVVTWNASQWGEQSDVYQQVFDENGGQIGTETGVNTTTDDYQTAKQVTALSDDSWVVTWVSAQQDGSGQGVYQQVYRLNGTTVETVRDEQRVNTQTNGDQSEPQVMALPGGGWVVTWNGAGEDGGIDVDGVYQQVYAANGAKIGGETRVNAHTPGIQNNQKIAALSDGSWVVTWESRNQDLSGSGVYQQAYRLNGNTVEKIGLETRVNVTTADNQSAPQIVALSGGSWAVTWTSNLQDGDGRGIYQRQYHSVGSFGAGTEVGIGTAADDVFDVAPGGLTAGDTLQGGGGVDTVRLTAAGTFDFTAPAVFADMERLVGSSGADTILVSTERLSGLPSIDGGDGIDTLELTAGRTLDIAATEVFTGVEKLRGSAEQDTIRVSVARLADVRSLEGGLGTDTLVLASGGTYDFAGFETFTGIEILLGSESNDVIVLDEAALADITRIEDLNQTNDTLVLQAGDYDLSDISIVGFETIRLDGDADVTFDDKALALLARTTSADASVTLTGGTFTQAEVLTLFRQGLRTVDDDAPGTYAYKAPALAAAPANASVAMTGEAKPFAGVDITVADGLVAVTATVTFDPTRGVLRSGDGAAHMRGSYTVSGTVAEVETALRALSFDPRDRIDVVGRGEDTLFTLTLNDAVSSMQAARVTVTSNATNLAPGEPTLSRSAVQENAKAGTLVGEVLAVDPNPQDGLTLTLSNDAGGRFEIVGGKLLVKAGAVLDFEAARFHDVSIRAADAGGLSVEKTFRIDVADVLLEQIRGTAGRDVLKGGLGQDAFVFDMRPTKRNVDKVESFVVKDDSLWLENAIYKGLGKKGSPDKPVVFKKDMFFLGTKAGDAEDRVIYDRKSGKLWYDEDGTGAKAQVLIAQMQKNLRLTEKDFFVI